MKNSTMKTIVLVLFILIPISVNSSEFVYKKFTLDIPDCEVTGGGIVNLPPYDSLMLHGRLWNMIFSDALFMEDCLLLSEKLGDTISCEEKNRILMFDSEIKKGSIAAQIFFSSQPADKINRQEYKDYILYSSVGLNKYSIAILVEKETGKTTEIKGKFTDEHLKWLRLETLE